MENTAHQDRNQRKHRHASHSAVSARVTPSHPALDKRAERVRNQKATRAGAILPRSGRLPNQTNVAGSNKQQPLRVLARAHGNLGREIFPRISGNVERPRKKNQVRPEINKAITSRASAGRRVGIRPRPSNHKAKAEQHLHKGVQPARRFAAENIYRPDGNVPGAILQW